MSADLDQITCSHSVDVEYRFGRPKVDLTPIELAQLMIARSKLGETQPERAAENVTAVASAEHTGRVHSV